MISLILLVIAVILFGLATFNVASPPRFGWLAGGLLSWSLSTLLAGAKF